MSIFAYFERREPEPRDGRPNPDALNIRWHGPVLEGRSSMRLAMQRYVPLPPLPPTPVRRYERYRIVP